MSSSHPTQPGTSSADTGQQPASSALLRIDLAGHKKTINRDIKEYAKEVRSDWKHGYEEQMITQSEIKVDLVDWVGDLFEIAIVNTRFTTLSSSRTTRGAAFRIASAGSSSSLAASIVFFELKLRDRIDIEEGDGEYEVKSDTFGVCYTDKKFSRMLTLFWKDLLLVAIEKGNKYDQLMGTIVKHLESLRVVDKLAHLLRSAEDVKNSKSTPENDAYVYQDLWLPANMRDMVPKLRELLFAKRIEGSTASPSIAVFDKLVKADPTLQSTLDAAVLARVFESDTQINKNMSKDDYLLAVRTLIKTPTTLPQLYLLAVHLHSMQSPWAISSACQAYTSLVKTSPEYCVKILPKLKTGINNAVEAVWCAAEVPLPGIYEANGVACALLEQGKLSKKKPKEKKGVWMSKEMMEWDRMIDQCVSAATGGRPEDAFYDHSDELDEDYQRGEDLAGPVYSWSSVLAAWPVKAEVKAIEEFVREGRVEFFEVEGLAEALASVCDDDFLSDSSGDFAYVGEGLRAVYGAFGV